MTIKNFVDIELTSPSHLVNFQYRTKVSGSDGGNWGVKIEVDLHWEDGTKSIYTNKRECSGGVWRDDPSVIWDKKLERITATAIGTEVWDSGTDSHYDGGYCADVSAKWVWIS